MCRRAWLRSLVGVTAAATSVLAAAEPLLHGPSGGGGHASVPCLDEPTRQAIQTRLDRNIALLESQGLLPRARTERRAPFSFEWPLRAAPTLTDPGFHGISNFVDHDAAFPNFLLDYRCGDRTYDLTSGYNHTGTDFFTWPFFWLKMDGNEVEAVAVDRGNIIFKQDGNFDRNCSFNNLDWNAVYVRHDDGSVAWYGHLKSGSLTTKGVGERVRPGEYLGVVGSSGSSTGPHLHLEIYDGQGDLIDPYQGACNELNPSSWWRQQRPYYDSAINRLASHASPPDFPACPEAETPNFSNAFDPGATVYLAAYYRDQLAGQLSQLTLYRPDGRVHVDWTHASSEPHFAASYWFWTVDLPASGADGVWRWEVLYEGEHYSHSFLVGVPGCDPGDARLCLSSERFQVEVTWRNFVGERGSGHVVPFDSDDSGLLWFFDADNWEMLVKVLDACSSPANSYWVFAAATTNVEYTLRVTDTVTGMFKEYSNPLGRASPAIIDTAAFSTCPDGMRAGAGSSVGGERESLSRRLERPALSRRIPVPRGAQACTPTLTDLCLKASRFRIEVEWRNFVGERGSANVVDFGTDDSGLLWFFDADNWEMLVKVLDACSSPANSYWVFAAATTNVEYTLRVTDTETGTFREYFNPLGRASPAITDTVSFTGCP